MASVCGGKGGRVRKGGGECAERMQDGEGETPPHPSPRTSTRPGPRASLTFPARRGVFEDSGSGPALLTLAPGALRRSLEAAASAVVVVPAPAAPGERSWPASEAGRCASRSLPPRQDSAAAAVALAATTRLSGAAGSRESRSRHAATSGDGGGGGAFQLHLVAGRGRCGPTVPLFDKTNLTRSGRCRTDVCNEITTQEMELDDYWSVGSAHYRQRT